MSGRRTKQIRSERTWRFDGTVHQAIGTFREAKAAYVEKRRGQRASKLRDVGGRYEWRMLRMGR